MSTNAEAGRVGEEVALAADGSRVSALGCPVQAVAEPHVALERVDASYDQLERCAPLP
jgi:hypothetical protein